MRGRDKDNKYVYVLAKQRERDNCFKKMGDKKEKNKEGRKSLFKAPSRHENKRIKERDG